MKSRLLDARTGIKNVLESTKEKLVHYVNQKLNDVQMGFHYDFATFSTGVCLKYSKKF